VFNEALWYGDSMEDTLINQNQLRYSGVIVHDNPFDTDKELSISNTLDGLSVPLKSEGTVIYFQSRTPTQQELQDCRHFVVTSDAIWNPREVRLGAVTANHGNESLVESFVCHDLRMLSTLSCVYDPYMFGESIRQVAQIDVPKLNTFVSSKRHSSVSPEDLSERWNIGVRQARDTIREIRKKWFRVMHAKSVPNRLWDYGVVWVCEIMQRTTSSSRYANGRTPIEIITGETPDISEYLDFGFYDWVFFKENAGMGAVALGRFLGVSHRVGNLMSYWILPVTGHIVSRTSVQRVTNLELQEDNLIRRCRAFDIAIKNYCNDEQYIIQPDANVPNFDLQLDLDDDPDYQEEFNRVLENKAIEDDDYTPDAHDQYLDMEITMPRGTDGTAEYAKVVKRAKDIDGKPIGKAHDNPVLDTRQYEVEWHDGKREIIFANTIAENLYSQVDQEGNRHVIFHDITAHRSTDEAVKDEDSYFITASGMK
jgi:hypothetical protein